eukprot:146757_1
MCQAMSQYSHLRSILLACGMVKHQQFLLENGFHSLSALNLLSIEDHYKYLNEPKGIMPIGDLSIIIQQIQIYSDGLKPTHHKLKSIKIEPQTEVIDLLSDGDDEEEDDDAVCREMKHEAEQTCNRTRNCNNISKKRRKRSYLQRKCKNIENIGTKSKTLNAKQKTTAPKRKFLTWKEAEIDILFSVVTENHTLTWDDIKDIYNDHENISKHRPRSVNALRQKYYTVTNAKLSIGKANTNNAKKLSSDEDEDEEEEEHDGESTASELECDITEVQNKPHSCGTCKKRFKRRSHLKDHQRVHNSPKRHLCRKCKKRFFCERVYKIHKC